MLSPSSAFSGGDQSRGGRCKNFLLKADKVAQINAISSGGSVLTDFYWKSLVSMQIDSREIFNLSLP